MTGILNLSRRDFLKTSGTASAVLILGAPLGACDKALGLGVESTSPNIFITLDTTGLVTIIAHRAEMGQGIRTGLPMVVAEELEADWERIKVQQADGDPRYGDQDTDGSKSIRQFFTLMRRVGASARLMLERSAAEIWGVPAGECQARNHKVFHRPTGRNLGYGELVAAAAKQEIPDRADVRLKNPKDFHYIGKKLPIVDLSNILEGKAQYGLDVQIPGMKYAVISRTPVIGGKVKTFDAAEALKVQGVIDVVELEGAALPPVWNNLSGVAVVAENTWAAMKGREKLKVDWDLGPNADYDSQFFKTTLKEAADNPQHVARDLGDVEAAFSAADEIIEASYYVPHLAHATMEPLNATAHYKEDGTLEMWGPAQYSNTARILVSRYLGIEVDKITFHQTLLGGGFGRKGHLDFVCEAARVSRLIGAPVKVTWSREDDIKHGFYHSVAWQKMTASLDSEKRVTGWKHALAMTPIGSVFSGTPKTSDAELNQGITDLPFDIANIRAEHAEVKAKVRIAWFRSVININTAFAINSFLDEVAQARGLDAITNFLDVLGPDRQLDYAGVKLEDDLWNYSEEPTAYPYETGRMRKVVELLANRGEWGRPLSPGHGLGFAAHRSFLTYVACLVEVAVSEEGKLTIPRVDYGVDCGLVVNPDRVRAQFEGGAIFGTSLALYGDITAKGGVIQQSNFHDYRVARIDAAPKEVHTHLVDSGEDPTGVGEPPVPPFAPALCNAIFSATGKRVRELPVKNLFNI